VDRERLRFVGNCDEGLNEAVAVDGTVFFELEAGFGPFDLAGYLSEARHLEGFEGKEKGCAQNWMNEKAKGRATGLKNDRNSDELSWGLQ
jgi:hypothetical protein